MWAGVDLLSLLFLNVSGGTSFSPGLSEGVSLRDLSLSRLSDSEVAWGCASRCPNLTNHVVISFPRNLDIIVSFPGGESLRGFILVTVLVEKAAVPGIKVFSSQNLFFFPK